MKLSLRALTGLLFGCVLCFVSAVAQTQSERSEYAVKAAFVYNFTKFVDWPASTDSTTALDSVFTIGVFGSSPITDELKRTIDNKHVRGLRVTVIVVEKLEHLPTCELVFFGDLTDDTLQAAISLLRRRPVLTIADRAHFVDRGGMIELYMANTKVRFDINSGAASQAGLSVRAQLMSLAQTLRPKGKS